MSGFWNSDSKRALAGETPSQTGVVFLRSWRTVGTPLERIIVVDVKDKPAGLGRNWLTHRLGKETCYP